MAIPMSGAAVAAGVSTVTAVGDGVADVHPATPTTQRATIVAGMRPHAIHQTNRCVWSRIMPPMCLIGSQKRPVEPPSSSDESV